MVVGLAMLQQGVEMKIASIAIIAVSARNEGCRHKQTLVRFIHPSGSSPMIL
jgi:hypothetical protein